MFLSHDHFSLIAFYSLFLIHTLLSSRLSIISHQLFYIDTHMLRPFRLLSLLPYFSLLSLLFLSCIVWYSSDILFWISISPTVIHLLTLQSFYIFFTSLLYSLLLSVHPYIHYLSRLQSFLVLHRWFFSNLLAYL